jgi:23S rRNA (cytosine1962-C5)-methyltransferase
MDLSSFGNTLETAWSKRSRVRDRNSAYRLLNGAASGTPGLIVDAFAEYLVVYAYEKEAPERLAEIASQLARITGAAGVTHIDRSRRGDSGREEGQVLLGSVPETADVHEGPLKFRVHPRHSRNVGLFLDTRMLRRILCETCLRHDVLNLFSYTCSLGIASAHANEGSVVNVDVSARYLGWGKENLALNGLPAERMKFVRMDSGGYLDWAAKKKLSFDVVILDPPSFSRSEAGTFSFANDYFRLLGKCARLVRPQGRIYALTNYGGIAPERFRSNLDDTVLAAGRGRAAIRRLPLPEDFDGAGDPSERGGAARGARSVEGTLIAFEATLL